MKVWASIKAEMVEASFLHAQVDCIRAALVNAHAGHSNGPGIVACAGWHVSRVLAQGVPAGCSWKQAFC